eukprot:2731042-Rhodomonas_salina.2
MFCMSENGDDYDVDPMFAGKHVHFSEKKRLSLVLIDCCCHTPEKSRLSLVLVDLHCHTPASSPSAASCSGLVQAVRALSRLAYSVKHDDIA